MKLRFLYTADSVILLIDKLLREQNTFSISKFCFCEVHFSLLNTNFSTLIKLNCLEKPFVFNHIIFNISYLSAYRITRCVTTGMARRTLTPTLYLITASTSNYICIRNSMLQLSRNAKYAFNCLIILLVVETLLM